MKNSKPRTEYGNVYFLDKRTNETKSKFDVISRDLIYVKRANNPNKSLSLRAMKLVNNYYDMVRKSNEGVVFVTHEFISSITQVGQNQNKNLHNELRDLFDIEYHKSVRIGGRRFHYGFTIRFTENTEEILKNPRAFYARSNNDNFDLNDKKLAVEGKKISISIDTKNHKEEPNRSTKILKKNFSEQENVGSNFQEKVLEDFYPISQEDCTELQILCKREFTLNAMNEILLDMSNRISKNPEKVAPSFKSKKGFMKYFAKCLRYEKRDAVKTSNENFKIKANMNQAEKQEEAEEKYLAEVEKSTQVSPQEHLKKKLASVLERSKAYKLLKAYKRLVVEDDIAKLYLHEGVSLTKAECEILLNQIKATHERFEGGEYCNIGKVELIVAEKPKSTPQGQTGAAQIPNTIWGAIRVKLINIYGQALDGHWFSKLDGIVDKANKTIEIKTPGSFYQSYVRENYLRAIENIVEQMGLSVKGITC